MTLRKDKKKEEQKNKPGTSYSTMGNHHRYPKRKGGGGGGGEQRVSCLWKAKEDWFSQYLKEGILMAALEKVQKLNHILVWFSSISIQGMDRPNWKDDGGSCGG